MSSNECCRNCQHFLVTSEVHDAWCRLRRMSVDYEFSSYALCHHWTATHPSLPSFRKQSEDLEINQQLELDDRSLVGFFDKDQSNLE